MGKRAPAAPTPPDPYATAQAQGAVNADTARLQARLNRNNTVTPWGSVTNRDMGNDQWESVVSLSPNQQRIADQGEQLDIRTADMALNALPRVQQIMASPLALQRDDADARERATVGIMSRLEPQFERDRTALESRLVAQGFTPGSEGYRQAADELSRMRTDARLQAITAGLGESRAAAGFNNQIALTERQQPLAELGMLFGLGPGMQMPQANQLAQTGVNPADLQGAVYNSYQGAMDNWRGRTQDRQATNANWFGLAGAGMRAFGPRLPGLGG